MKIPQNMTEQEVLSVINKVVDKTSGKYTFYGYTIDDIKQESYIICIEALERYDENRPLENFLSVNLSNRLKNFIRDNHFMANSDPQRVRVIQPAQLEFEDTLLDNGEKFAVDETEHDYNYLVENIDRFLPADMRMDYLKLINDVYMPRARRIEITEKIVEIMEDCGYEER
jgi:DNA-directed RNA polymerase specialized sigma subunit